VRARVRVCVRKRVVRIAFDDGYLHEKERCEKMKMSLNAVMSK